MTVFDFGWPWMGLGMAFVLIALLFGTNLLRSNDKPRWRDPIWLGWCAMPAYLIHQFEEYACHITNGQYDIITQVFIVNPMDLTNLPLEHFPLVNIMLVWFGVPLAVMLGKKLKNPAIALAPYGFILVNGLGHVLGSLSGAMPIDMNPGFYSGLIIFLPLTILVIVQSVRHFMSVKALVIALVSGAIAHVLLGAAYAVAVIAGPMGVLAMDVVAGLSSGLLAWLFCKVFKVKFDV